MFTKKFVYPNTEVILKLLDDLSKRYTSYGTHRFHPPRQTNYQVTARYLTRVTCREEKGFKNQNFLFDISFTGSAHFGVKSEIKSQNLINVPTTFGDGT